MIDLHMHSTFSDGSMTPEELVDMAHEGGVSVIALTDHDTTGGIPRFLAAGKKMGVTTIPGVEISAQYQPGTMHMLGYYIDPQHVDLNEHLRWIRAGREARNKEILHKLMELGCHITWEEVASFAGEDVVGRPHFARALIEKGCVKDTNQAFKKYLAKGAPAYADRRRLAPVDSITLIRSAGGVPVLAHPFTLRLNTWDLRKELRKLSEEGLQGIEAYYSEHSAEMTRQYVKLAEDYDLVVTGGTDYHGASTPDLAMGRGFGSLRVPESTVEALKARCTAAQPIRNLRSRVR